MFETIKSLFEPKPIIEGRWTPNEALADIRGCSPDSCNWVLVESGFGNKEMSRSEAFRAAREIQRDL